MASVYSAARRGDASRIQTLMNSDMDPSLRLRMLEYTDERGRTPLNIASQKGHLSCVLELLSCGANVHHMSKVDFGGTALHMAAYYKWRSNGIVEALLRQGANPFVKNKHERTVLQLAMIENASRHLYIPWVMSFDEYGYYAEELTVMTSSLNAPTAYVSRWVTIIPMYSTSEPSRMQSQKKMLVIYDGDSTRTLISNIDLTDAHAEWSQGSHFVKLTLSRSHIQPSGVASVKNRAHHWTIQFNARDPDRVLKLDSFIQAINEHIPTIVQQQQNDTREGGNGVTSETDQASLRTSQRGSEAGSNEDLNFTLPSTELIQTGGDGVCVVCLDHPQTTGFLHGNSIHYCVCETCALQIFRSDRKQCPICRMQIERVITQVQSPHIKNDCVQRS